MTCRDSLDLTSKTALVLIDVQIDLSPGGAYPVPNGDEVIAPLNEYMQLFRDCRRPIFAVKDYHPLRTGHFKEFGGELPAHCVKGTQGSELHPGLRFPEGVAILAKGDRLADDGESAFDGRDAVGVNLRGLFEKSEVEVLCIGGLATEDSVMETTLEALHYGYRVILLEDALRGRNITPGDSDKAMEEMKKCGAEVVTLEQLQGGLVLRGSR